MLAGVGSQGRDWWDSARLTKMVRSCGPSADDRTAPVNIAAEHPDAGDPLLDHVAMALERWGARVCVAADADNLIRRLAVATTPRPDREAWRGLPDPDARKGAPVAEVHAQGLPNLLHEFVHIILADRLDDDHGIDYHAIPFDLGTAPGRRVLFEELACAVVSCAYLSRSRTQRGVRESDQGVRTRVDAWFAEQVEIQPVFYGQDDDLSGFLDRVEEVGRRFRGELEAVMDLAYARCEAALTRVGATPAVARTPRRLTLHGMLVRQGRTGIA